MYAALYSWHASLIIKLWFWDVKPQQLYSWHNDIAENRYVYVMDAKFSLAHFTWDATASKADEPRVSKKWYCQKLLINYISFVLRSV